MRRFSDKNVFMFKLILPGLLVLVLFEIIPIIVGIYNSLFESLLYKETNPFVGLKNYLMVLSNPHFFSTVLPNTAIYTIVCLFLQLILGLGIASLLNRKFRAQNLVMVFMLLPLMIPPVISGYMFYWMFNYEFGLVNAVFSMIHLPTWAWLASHWGALFVIILANVWAFTPWMVLLILAGLQNIPEAPIEAAKLEGANVWQIFRHVTLPLLTPVLSVCVLIRFFDLFRQFDQVWVITKGGPGRATELFSVYAYKESMIYLRFGTGTAASIIGAVIILAVGIVAYRSFRTALMR